MPFSHLFIVQRIRIVCISHLFGKISNHKPNIPRYTHGWQTAPWMMSCRVHCLAPGCLLGRLLTRKHIHITGHLLISLTAIFKNAQIGASQYLMLHKSSRHLVNMQIPLSAHGLEEEAKRTCQMCWEGCRSRKSRKVVSKQFVLAQLLIYKHTHPVVHNNDSK